MIRDFAARIPNADVQILDHYLHSLDPFSADLAGDSFVSDVCVISTTPSYLFWRCPPTSLSLVRSYIKLIRQHCSSTTIILVGPHGTAEPESTLRLTGADFAYRGELESGLVDAIVGLKASSNHRYLASKGQKNFIAPEQPFKEMPLIYPSESIACSEAHTWAPSMKLALFKDSGRYAMLETSRGCSFNCDYCFRSGFRRSLRLKPILTIRQEVERITQLGVSYVFLIDETFGLPKSHVKDVLEIFKFYNLKFGLQTRPDIWTKREIDNLVYAGCLYVELGTESLSEEGIGVLSKFRDVSHVLELTNYFRLRVPYVGVNVIDVGNPDLNLLSRSLAKLELDNEGKHPPAFIPYPNTPWGDRALLAAKATRSWDDVAALYGVYALMARHGFIAALLRRVALARYVARILLRALSAIPIPKAFFRTRFERHHHADLYALQASKVDPAGLYPLSSDSPGANEYE
ncbi:MAG: radical SAM protein [Ketobacter sp.]|nr:radical SAM protein [Ketobacter sp.]